MKNWPNNMCTDYCAVQEETQSSYTEYVKTQMMRTVACEKMLGRLNCENDEKKKNGIILVNVFVCLTYLRNCLFNF